jgi:hypothetical protein
MMMIFNLRPIDKIKSNDLQKGQRLFFTNGNKETPIKSSVYTYTMGKIVSEYRKVCDNEDILRRFTQYGMVKYAIIQMLNANINIAHIVDLTGTDVELVMNCREDDMYVSKKLSDYLNIKIRTIKTFSVFN